MADHDIICPLYQTGDGGKDCRCGVINLARDNERARLRARVEALNGILTAKFDGGQDVLLWRSEVIALLNNEGERDGNTQEPRP